jgi:hypothetical protein
MTDKKKVFEHTPTGRITKYNINYDIERFTFLPDPNSFFEKVMEKVNYSLNNIVGQKPYQLNWEEINQEYIRMGQFDVPLFASQYVFAKFMNMNRAGEKRNMQMMYLEIVAVINAEIELGNLPSKVK